MPLADSDPLVPDEARVARLCPEPNPIIPTPRFGYTKPVSNHTSSRRAARAALHQSMESHCHRNNEVGRGNVMGCQEREHAAQPRQGMNDDVIPHIPRSRVR
jgi:hypothetical protein